MAEGRIDSNKHMVGCLWRNVVVVYDWFNRQVFGQRRPLPGGRHDNRGWCDGIDDVEQCDADRHRYDETDVERFDRRDLYDWDFGFRKLLSD